MAMFNSQSRLLLGRNEEEFGKVVKNLTSADGDVRVRNLELTTLATEFDDESSKFFDGTLTHDRAIAGVQRGVIDFGIKVAPGEFSYVGGVLGTSKLPYGKYMKSAGLKMTPPTPPTSFAKNDGYWTFAPNNSALCQTSTLAIYDVATSGVTPVGIQYKFAGAMAATFNITSESAGKPFLMTFTMNGKVDDVIEVTGATVPEFNEDAALHTLAGKMLNTIIRITSLNDDGTTLTPEVSKDFCSNTFSLDAGLTLTEIMCQSDNSGLLGYTITARDERITIEPLLEKLDDFNFWTAMTSEKPYKIQILSYLPNAPQTLGTEWFSIEVPYAQMITAEGSDDSGLRRLSMTFRPLKNILGVDIDEKQAVYSIKIGGVNTGTAAYEIEYDANGGTLTGEPHQTITKDSKTTEVSVTAVAGSTFEKWAVDPTNAVATAAIAGATVNIFEPDANVTFMANYTTP